ncbi:PIG-L deacetylase family protein [Algoriphagus taiwanensis]|uniref:PIG-L family deacetylase n=1 Tax=Algoriphagus taiwanensis TaxID=1445656 RepID=A0ABQ6Q2W7_9BACT|nr:hypothetical protein Ataiwa_27690 [Algoriphagus taiwanensis]
MNFRKVLVLSPHTDDAELGAGGLIYKLLKDGAQIYWVVFSTAEESLPTNMPKNTLEMEFRNVLKDYNLSESSFKIFNYPVRKLIDYRQEILEFLVKLKVDFSPDLVIGPSLNDYHQDHQIIANEMVRAYKTFSSILCYELPWNHLEFKSTFFVNLTSEEINFKLQVLNNYKSQILLKRRYFQDDFILALARAKGSQISVDFAETFDVVRLKY